MRYLCLLFAAAFIWSRIVILTHENLRWPLVAVGAGLVAFSLYPWRAKNQ